MNTILLKLHELQNTLSSTESNIIKYVRSNPEEVSKMTIRQLAEKTYSSPASVVRVCRSVGFEGYKDFKQALISELAVIEKDMPYQQKKLSEYETIESIIDNVTINNIRSLEETQHLLDVEVIEKCVELLINSRAILLFGIGASLHVAKDAHLKFLRLNKICVVNDDWHSQLLQARNSCEKDVAIIFSYSGQTHEMIECMKELKENQTKCILVTRYAASPAAELADYKIYISSNESLVRNGAMSSRLASLNVVDILFTGFASKQYEYSMNQIVHTHINKEE